LQLLFAAAGKNARLPKGIVSLVKVAREDDGLGSLPEGCDGVGHVILKERDGQAVVKDKGNRPVVLTLLARGQDAVADPIRPNNLCLICVEPSFLLMVAKAELCTLKNVTLSDGLLTSGVAAMEGALKLALAEGGPTHDKGLVVVLAAPEDLNNSFIAGMGHETAEGKVDRGGTGFSVNECVDSVKLLVTISKLLVEDVPDTRRLIIVLVKALLELAVGVSVGSIAKHWSVGECVRAAGAGEHGKGATQCQGPKEGTVPTGGTPKKKQHAG
jgi:hypothetical protein